MARFYPSNDAEFSRISGVGDKKLHEFGAAFLGEIAKHLQTNARQIFADDSFATPTKPKKQSNDAPCDQTLFERLRRVRKRLAEERGVSAFIILYDSALRQIAREYPATEAQFGQIRNVGPKKAKDFGSLFLAEIAEHLQSNPHQIFAED